MGGFQGTTHLGTAPLSAAHSGRIAAVADLNGDGHPDLVWQDPVSGRSQVWFLHGTTMVGAATIAPRGSWRIVAAADFDRDGHLDLVRQDPVSGHAQIAYLGARKALRRLAWPMCRYRIPGASWAPPISTATVNPTWCGRTQQVARFRYGTWAAPEEM